MSASAKSILWVRHGATSATLRACFSGVADSPLSDEGLPQVRELAGVVADFGLDRCFSSPLCRCRQTAEILLATRDHQITELAGLREMDFGNWEGKTYSEIARDDQAGLDRMIKFDRTFAPGGGERIGAFWNRARRTLQTILEAPDERLLVVTHGGVIRAALCVLLRLNPNQHFNTFEITPAGMAEVLVFDGGAVLQRLSPGPRGKEVAP